MSLKTDYKDEILRDGEYRRYDLVDENGKVVYANIRLDKAYTPKQDGDEFNAKDINSITSIVNSLQGENLFVNGQFTTCQRNIEPLLPITNSTSGVYVFDMWNIAGENVESVGSTNTSNTSDGGGMSIISKKDCEIRQAIVFNHLWSGNFRNVSQKVTMTFYITGSETIYFNEDNIIAYCVDTNDNKKNITIEKVLFNDTEHILIATVELPIVEDSNYFDYLVLGLKIPGGYNPTIFYAKAELGDTFTGFEATNKTKDVNECFLYYESKSFYYRTVVDSYIVNKSYMDVPLFFDKKKSSKGKTSKCDLNLRSSSGINTTTHAPSLNHIYSGVLSIRIYPTAQIISITSIVTIDSSPDFSWEV